MGEAMANTLGFAICRGRGFHITFKNGVTVSVQFGPGNYCEHYNGDWRELEKEKSRRRWECFDAEVAIWDNREEDNWITQEYFQDDSGECHGYLIPDELPALLMWAANYKRA